MLDARLAGFALHPKGKTFTSEELASVLYEAALRRRVLAKLRSLRLVSGRVALFKALGVPGVQSALVRLEDLAVLVGQERRILVCRLRAVLAVKVVRPCGACRVLVIQTPVSAKHPLQIARTRHSS